VIWCSEYIYVDIGDGNHDGKASDCIYHYSGNYSVIYAVPKFGTVSRGQSSCRNAWNKVQIYQIAFIINLSKLTVDTVV
jgi:hypothetical protein